jgi:glycosyltransferase involved in cell wall biosynthesis
LDRNRKGATPEEETGVKIAVVVSTFPPYRGGMGNMARTYAVELARRGHEVEVFCPAYGPIDEPPAEPYRIHRLKPRFAFRNSAFIPQLYDRLKHFDVVNLHYPFYGGAEAVLRLKKSRKAALPLVVNFQMDTFGKGPVGWGMKAYARWFLPSVLNAADRVIVTSFDYAAHSGAAAVFGKHPEKFRAVPPGVDVERFSPRKKDPDCLVKFGIRPESRIVLFVGGLDSAHAFKGVDFLLETWAQGNDRGAKLIIVGRGNLRDRYIRRAADLGIAGSVVFAAEVGEDDLPAVYNLADLFILPSVDRSEAFGIVLIEALASGVPILASGLPGVRSVVEEGRNGFTFRVKDRSDLAAKLNLVLDDEKLRGRMAAWARTIAVSRYNQTAVGAEVERIMAEAFETRAGGKGNIS